MELFIGGRAQGKSNYVLENHREYKEKDIMNGYEITKETLSLCYQKPILNHFHAILRFLLKESLDYEDFITKLLVKNPSVLIICDEVGLGIVPMEAFEREYRENVGRACTQLAKKATQVTRIFCGMGQQLK